MIAGVKLRTSCLGSVCAGTCLVVLLFVSVTAQLPPDDPCSRGTTVTIAINECDPPGVPNSLPQTISLAPQSYKIQVVDEMNNLNPQYPFSQFFSVSFNPNVSGWVVSMIQCIDRDGPFAEFGDDVNILQYQLQCEIPGYGVIYNILKCVIEDVNENVPVLLNLPYVATVSESTPVGMTVYTQVSATDLDEGKNKQIVFTLSKAPGSHFDGTQYFNLPVVGEANIAVYRPFDYEVMKAAGFVYFNLTITATDQGNPQRSATAPLVIYVEDADDLGPEYVYPSCILDGETCVLPKYVSKIAAETSTPSTLVVTPDPVDKNNPSGTVDIIAQDRDDLNSTVLGSVLKTIPGGYESLFRVTTSQIGSTKQYVYAITYLPDARKSIKEISEIELVLKAEEQTSNKRCEYASVVVKVTHDGTPGSDTQTSTTTPGNTPGRDTTTGTSACPAGFTEERIISTSVLCRAVPECSGGGGA